MKSLISYFSQITPSMLFGAVLLSLIDLVWTWVTADPALAEFAPVVEGTLLEIALLSIVAVLVATALALAAVAIEKVWTTFGRPLPGQPFRQLALNILGRDATSIAAFVGTILLLCVSGGLLWWVTAKMPAESGLENVERTIAELLLATACFILPIAGHRVIALRWAIPPFSHLGVILYLIGAAYWIVSKWWAFASPFTIWIPLILLLSLSGALFVRGLDRIEFGAAKRRSAWLSLCVVALSILRLAFYPAETEAHADAMMRSMLSFPARQILVTITDLDGDGASSILGGSDCDAFDPEIRPLRMEEVANGVDDNCSGGDLEVYEADTVPLPELQIPVADRPHVILITIDTIRGDAVGRSRRGKPLTPNIDALMDASARFTRAYSTSSHTDESIPALLTGMYPHDWHQWGIYFGVERTLPEILTEAGYHTVGVLAFPWLKSALIHGVDVVDNTIGQDLSRYPQLVTGARTTELALQYLDEAPKNQPLFLWAHFFDPHAPYIMNPAHEDWLGDDTYEHELVTTDQAVGLFLQGLVERGIYDKALIVLTGDHGEGLGEHGLQTHQFGLWEAVVRIPMSIRVPGLAPAVSDSPASLADVLPTVLELLRIDDPVTREGTSLLPFAFEGKKRDSPIFVEVETNVGLLGTAIVQGDMKLIHDLKRDAFLLYDVVQDPSESTNLLAERPAQFKTLRNALEAWRDRGFNDVRLRRKAELWDARGTFTPRIFLGNDAGLVVEPGID